MFRELVAKDGTRQLVNLPVICARTAAIAQVAYYIPLPLTTIVKMVGILITLLQMAMALMQPKSRKGQNAAQVITLTAALTMPALFALRATTAYQMVMAFTPRLLEGTADKINIVRPALLLLPTTV